MSSIIMHLYMSYKVGKELNLSNKFFAGSVLPDLIKIKTQKRDETHYIDTPKNELKRLPNLERFLEENKNALKDELTLGYYAHLIEDKIWFDTYISSFAKKYIGEKVIYLKDDSVHTGKEFTKDVYADYGIVDDYLINQNDFDLDKIRDEIKKELKEYEVDYEIDTNINRPSNLSTEVNFITHDILDRYMKESIDTATSEIKKIIGE